MSAEREARDPRIARGLWVSLCVLLAAGVVLRLTAPGSQATTPTGLQTAVATVPLLRLVPEVRRPRVELSGVVEPRRIVHLASETEGRVVRVGAEDLAPVEAGQVLAEVDPRLARVAVERAEAAMARSESQLGLARTSLGRQQSLAERSVASDSALDDASNRSRVAEAAIREARADLERARDALAKKTLRAPFRGVLRDFELELGEYVRVGQELGELLDLDAVRVSVGLTDRQIVEARLDAPVRVRIEALALGPFAGRIVRAAAAADLSTRQFPVEIEVANPERRILPGMVARVALELGSPEERLIVPRQAVGEEFGLRFVWIVEEDSGLLRAKRRRVRVRELAFDPSLLEVLDGVRAGETLATGGLRVLRDGMEVRAAGALREATAGDAS